MIFGGYLVTLTSIQTVSDTYSGQSTICSLQFSTKLAANQESYNTCSSAENGWVSLSLTSTSNFTLSLRQDSTLLFSKTSTSIEANLPLFSNGTLVVEVNNTEPFSNSIQGFLNVEVASTVVSTSSFLIEPYRTVGVAITAIFGFFLIFLIVRPIPNTRFWHIRSR